MLKKKKRKLTIFKFLFSVLIAYYLFVLISGLFEQAPQTGLLTNGEISIRYSAKAVIIRDEYTIRSQDAVALMYLYKDGERVRKHAELIYLFPEPHKSLLTDIQRIKSEINEIKKMQISYDTEADNAIVALRARREKALFTIYENDISLANTDVLERQTIDLNSHITDRLYSVSSKNNDVDTRESELLSIYDSLKSEKLVIMSPESGVFTSRTDGYESTSARDFIEMIDQDKIQEIIRNPSGYKTTDKNIGKLVLSDDHFFILEINSDIAQLIKDKTYIRIIFPGISESFNSIKHQIKPLDNGNHLLVLRTDRYLELLVNSRAINLYLLIDSYNGIKVPLDSLINFDPNKTKTEIFIVRNGRVIKIDVDIIASDRYYAIISSDSLDPGELYIKNPANAREGMLMK